MDPWYLVLCFSNAFLSYTATMLNIVTIHAIRKTPSLSKNLKTLLLSQAISDLGVGLLVQPIFVAQLVMESTQDNESSNSYNVIYIARLITTSFFYFATLLIVIVLCAERFASTFISDTKNLRHTGALLLWWSQFGYLADLFL